MGDTTDTTQQPLGQYSFGAGMFALPQQAYGGLGYSGAQIQDPMMIGPQMQQLWARGLLGQAADVSPVRSPWQAAARAVSGLLGGYEAGDAARQMNAVLGQQQAAARASLGDVNRIMSGLGGQQGTTQQGAAQPPPQGGGLEPAASAEDINGLPDVQKLPQALQGPFAAAATKYQLGPNAAAQWARMLMAESGGQHMISSPSGSYVTRSPAGALGVAQVMPQTFAEMKQKYGIQGDISDPTANLEAGTAYFKQGLQAANGDLAGSAAYYNAGPGGLSTYQKGGTLPQETQAYLTKTGAPTVTAAQNVTTDAAGNAVIGGSNGFQTAMALRQKALQMSMSMNPYERMMAPQLMQQAAAVANMGAFKTVVMPNGQIANVNSITGQTTVTGAARTLTKDSAENLVDNQGNIVVPHGNYTGGQPFGPGGNQRLYFDPSGKPVLVGEPPRGDVAARMDITNLGQKYIQGALTPADQLQLDTAIATQYKPKTSDAGVVNWETPPPQWVKDYYAGRGAATPGGTGGAPVPTQMQVQAGQKYFEDTMTEANKALAEEQAAVGRGQDTYGTTQQIRALMAQTRMGWSAEARAQAVNILAGLGGDRDALEKQFNATPLSNTQALDKLFMTQTMSTVAGTLGKREPGSLVMTAMNRFPNLESQPEAADILLREQEMNQAFHRDRANALAEHIRQGVIAASSPGGKPTDFKGMGGFGWDKDPNNSAAVYGAAGMLAATRGRADMWKRGLTAQQIDAAEQLAARQYPGEIVYTPPPPQQASQ